MVGDLNMESIDTLFIDICATIYVHGTFNGGNGKLSVDMLSFDFRALSFLFLLSQSPSLLSPSIPPSLPPSLLPSPTPSLSPRDGELHF